MIKFLTRTEIKMFRNFRLKQKFKKFMKLYNGNRGKNLFTINNIRNEK